MTANVAHKSDNANIALVQGMYAAYLRGDIETVVAASTADVVFGLDGRTRDFPLLGPRQGAAGVREFFRVLAETQDIADFEPQEFYADRDKVFVLGRYAWTMRNSGRCGDTEWLHVFTFRNGKLAAFRSLNDTALLAEAHRG